MALDDILRQGEHLPAIPRVVTELLATFKREDCTADDIARLISADAGLSAKVLRLANSAFYRRAREVTSVRSATVVVGYVPLRMLIAGLGVAAGVPAPQGMDRRRFWRWCLHVGVTARVLAPRVQADPEAAFSAGLLHAVGHPAIRGAIPDVAKELEQAAPFHARERAALERERLGFDYAEVGGKLAEMWCFPQELVHAIRHSTRPLQAPEFSALTAVVRVAAEMMSAWEEGYDQGQAAGFVDPALLASLQLTLDHLAAVPPVEELAAGMETLFS